MAVTYGKHDIETPIQNDLDEAVEHGIIVSNLAYFVGKEMDLSEEMCYDLAVAGVVHDIGKIHLSFYMNETVDEILAVDETRYLRMHPSIGYSILQEYEYNQNVLDAVLYHHEHYDGTGYPNNLSGREIPLAGRIMHVCDIFGALISNRDYRSGFDVETALSVMIDDVKNFDMKVYLAFQRVAFSRDFNDIIGNKEISKKKEEQG